MIIFEFTYNSMAFCSDQENIGFPNRTNPICKPQFGLNTLGFFHSSPLSRTQATGVLQVKRNENGKSPVRGASHPKKLTAVKVDRCGGHTHIILLNVGHFTINELRTRHFPPTAKTDNRELTQCEVLVRDKSISLWGKGDRHFLLPSSSLESSPAWLGLNKLEI